MNNLPFLGPLPLHVWGGILGFCLLIFQVLTGFHYIKAKPQTHKVLGLVLLGLAFVHGIISLSVYL